MITPSEPESNGPRPRGRPRTEIDLDAVAEAVAGLIVEGGVDAVSIVNTANRLDVSRATLYRSVPNKADLVGILFERTTRRQGDVLAAVVDAKLPAREKLERLIELQVEASIRMRGYLPVFFGGGGLAADVYYRWQAWSRDYEKMWTRCVEQGVSEGILVDSDSRVTTRLVLGMCLWVSRWYRPEEGINNAEIARSAIALLLPAVKQRTKGKR